jgi:hypothetical protein
MVGWFAVHALSGPSVVCHSSHLHDTSVQPMDLEINNVRYDDMCIVVYRQRIRASYYGWVHFHSLSMYMLQYAV